jgi:anti-sigma regulatory factor (Ser/Thr protein kinase)
MEFIEKILEAAGFSPRKVMEVQLTVAEALMSIINHFYHGGDGMIDIISDAHEDGLVVTLKDEGSKFDPIEVERGLIFLAM